MDNTEARQSQRPKNEGPAWRPNQNTWVKKEWNGPSQNASLTFEAMLDGPCRYHTTDPRKPANHSTRNCSWTLRIQADGQKGPPPRVASRPNYRPNTPLSGANATPVNTGAPRPAATKPVYMVNMGATMTIWVRVSKGVTLVTATGRPTKAMWCLSLSPTTRRVSSGEQRR